jgi:hypothetical protein
MRRIVVVAAAVVALLGALSPPVSAQAPAPKVTINGLIDTATVGGNNFSDSNYATKVDSTWHARNRGVFTVTGEVGKAKGVVALEIDLAWGSTGQNESINSAAGNTITSSANAVGNGGVAFTNGAMDLGIDAAGIIEVKNLYVEFPVPWIPFPTVTRLGGQPLQVTMKPAVLASTDAGGIWISSTVAPFLKVNATYIQVEEQVTGFRGSTAFTRGDDFFFAPSVDIIPMKGITIRPLWLYFSAQGNTNASSRCRVQCAGLPSNGGNVSVSQITGAATGTANTGHYRVNSTEDRHYFAVDAQTNFGPFYLDPTVIYMTADVDVYRTVAGAAGTHFSGLQQGSGPRLTQNIRSWLVDVRGGWRAGPLLLEGLFVWTPGDDAQHDSFRTSRVYHPISTDGAGWGGWADILSPGTVDYLTGAAPGINENGGLGRYGIWRIGGRASYALTPAFSVRAGWNTWWTDTDVDTDAVATTTSGSFGVAPCAGPGGQGTACRPGNNQRGDEDYIGTEVSAGITYRFAPGLTFDMVYAHLFAGGALNSTFTPRNGGFQTSESADADLAAARVRYQF